MKSLTEEYLIPKRHTIKFVIAALKWREYNWDGSVRNAKKGVYNFLWLDDIVDNFCKRGIEPMDLFMLWK